MISRYFKQICVTACSEFLPLKKKNVTKRIKKEVPGANLLCNLAVPGQWAEQQQEAAG